MNRQSKHSFPGPRTRREKFHPHIEGLENRSLLSAFTVTTSLDNGNNASPLAGSLRAAIVAANADTDPNGTSIVLNIPTNDPNHVYYKTDGSIGVTSAADDSAIADSSRSWPHSWWSIKPVLHQLPAITRPMLIDGTSQPGSSMNSNAGADNAVIRIELDGSVIGNSESAWGFSLTGSGITVRGFDIHNYSFGGITSGPSDGNVIQGNFIGMDVSGSAPDIGDGISVGGPAKNLIGTDGDGVNDYGERNVVLNIGLSGSNNVVAGNFIGTDSTGTKPLDTRGTEGGVHVYSGWGGNRIGVSSQDADPGAERNVISGNAGAGVALEGTGHNTVAGNLIGVDVTGKNPLPNLLGGVAVASDDNLIGTDGDGVGDGLERNVISSNGASEVALSGVHNVLAGNFIGTDAAGTYSLGTARLSVSLTNSFSDRIGTDGNGAASADEANVIVGPGDAILSMQSGGNNSVAGNLIGTDVHGSPLVSDSHPIHGIDLSGEQSDAIGGALALANRIVNGMVFRDSTGITARFNKIYSNQGTPITLVSSNHQQSAPVLSSVTGGQATQIAGSLSSVRNTTFTLDFYANPAAGFMGFAGGAQAYVGTTTVITDSSGNATFNVAFPFSTAVGDSITATATLTTSDSSNAQYSDTSQLSLGYVTSVFAPSSLSGTVFADFNHDGQVDFGEQGIAGVTITLTGTDDLGNAVNPPPQMSDADGTYVFLNLRPGTYTITESQQPPGYTPGITSVGTVGGTVSGQQFTVCLPAGLNGMNYNFAELPNATGAIQPGQSAGIGFWNNKNGQALIKALNGGTGTQLGDWLAATFPHIFGALAGSNDLARQNNAYVASFFQSKFIVHGQRLDAQVLATALAVYVTDPTLDNTGVGVQYGFTVSGNGLATSTINVGTNGAAFGVADNTVMAVMDILLAADAQAVNGILYNGDTTKRDKANKVFSGINQTGHIG